LECTATIVLRTRLGRRSIYSKQCDDSFFLGSKVLNIAVPVRQHQWSTCSWTCPSFFSFMADGEGPRRADGEGPRRHRKAPRRYDDETVSFTPQRLPKIAGRRVPGWEPRGRGCDKWTVTRKVVAIDEVLSEVEALERYKNKFVTPYERADGTDRGILRKGWQVFNCQRGTVLELVDEGQRATTGRRSSSPGSWVGRCGASTRPRSSH